MNKFITISNLKQFAYVNHAICRKPIRGIVISFFGLGNTKIMSAETSAGVSFGERGILYVHPYNDPWNWMNRQSVACTDEIIDVLIDAYALPEDIPVVSTGGSMGGLCSLVYARYAKRTPVACVANCPVCDLPYHLTEREDLPRTLYSAFWHEEGELADVLKTASPLHLAADMPDIDYYIFHCTADKAVNKEKHSDKFVSAMKTAGRNVIYHTVEGCGHCDLPDDMRALFHQYAAEEILSRTDGAANT
ncbi:MAG: prolyl oligopeptidase family serine peptidase [Clostridia bacterium]|nr:prolyl oligopeptidase family serine peptidase [Clostridia bacterium]